MKQILCAGIFIFMLSSCENDKKVMEEIPSGCDTTSLTYDNAIANIINSNCAFSGCHNNDGYIYSLTDYAHVSNVVNNGVMEDRLLYADDPEKMPRGFNLNECDKAKLLTWIRKGGPKE